MLTLALGASATRSVPVAYRPASNPSEIQAMSAFRDTSLSAAKLLFSDG